MMFSKTLATEVVKDNIRVNCINPGLVLTPDWIKTAKQLTADKGGDWEGYLQGVADEHGDDQALRDGPRSWRTSSSSSAPTRRPTRRLDLLRRRRDAEDGDVRDRARDKPSVLTRMTSGWSDGSL